jgi:hypothetical protein
MRIMARLRHTLALRPLPRHRAEAAVAAFHDVAEGLRPADGGRLVAEDGRAVPDVVLRSGDHLRPGARYAVANGTGDPADGALRASAVEELSVLAWDRGAETALRLDAAQETLRAAFVWRLRSADRPARLRLTADGSLTRPDGRRRPMRWFALRGELDLARWWDAVGAGPADGPPPLAVDIRHSLLRAAVRARPRPGTGGAWRVEVTATVQGRGLARPFAAVPLWVTRRLLDRAFQQALERAAADWGDRLVPELDRSPEELRAALLAGLTRS